VEKNNVLYLRNFPIELEKRIDEIKERTGLSRAKIIAVLIEKALEQKISFEMKIY